MFDLYWEMMREYNVATEDELLLACYLCGMSVNTLEQVLFIRTGNRNLEQFCEDYELDYEELIKGVKN